MQTYDGNKQAFVNNPSIGLLPEDSEQFHGGIDPNLSIQKEKPEHYLVLMMKVQGKTNREIALKSGYSEAWVSQICRQPWFKARLFQELTTKGGDVIQEVLRMEVLPSLQTLIDIRDDPNAGERARISASIDLLDRFMGKATQRVETYKNDHTKDVKDASELDKKIDEAEARIKELEGGQ